MPDILFADLARHVKRIERLRRNRACRRQSVRLLELPKRGSCPWTDVSINWAFEKAVAHQCNLNVHDDSLEGGRTATEGG